MSTPQDIDPDNLDEKAGIELVPRPEPYPLEQALVENLSASHIDIPDPAAPEPWDAPQTTAVATDQPPVPATHSDVATAPAPVVPQSLEQWLQCLPPWQGRYVLALMEYGGIIALACSRTKVSRDSVEKAQAQSPAFLRACHLATEHSTDLAEAATYRGATIGDLEPKFHQGVIVGYVRKRDTRAAELLFKLRGRLKEGGSSEDATKGPQSAVQVITDQHTLTVTVSETITRLFEERRKHSLGPRRNQPTSP